MGVGGDFLWAADFFCSYAFAILMGVCGGFLCGANFFLMRYFCFFMRLILMSRVDSFIAYGYLTFFNAWPQDTPSWTINQLSLCHFGGCHFIPLYALIL